MSPVGVIIVKAFFALGGLMCIVFGFLIGVRGKISLIAGCDQTKVKDEKGLSRFIGIFTFIIGLFTILFPWVLDIEKFKPLIWVLYFCVPVIVIAVVMVIGASRYEHKSIKKAEDK